MVFFFCEPMEKSYRTFYVANYRNYYSSARIFIKMNYTVIILVLTQEPNISGPALGGTWFECGPSDRLS